MIKRTGRSGFTLLEMVLVIGLMGVVTTLAASAFFTMTDYWREVRSRTDLDAQADAAFAQIRGDLDSMVSPTLANAALKGVDRWYKDQAEIVAAPEQGDDELTFPAYMKTSGGIEGSGQVTYQVVHENGQHLLKRIQLDMAGQFKDSLVVMHEDVDALWFDVRFAGADGAWTADGNWSQAVPPAAVRVELTLRDRNTGEQVVRQATLPVHVS